MEQKEALARRFLEEGFNGRRLAVVDEIFAPDFAVNGQVVGRAGLKQSMGRFLGAFPDLQVTIDEIVGEGDLVGIWYTAEGTHRAEFQGIPASGKRVKWVGADLFHVEGGTIARARFVDDSLGVLRQLGVTLSPDPASPRS
jgi:steroid delta-isomerase-like uncharacterized protein